MIITSLQNQQVKQAVKLRDRRQREKQRRFLIDGARELFRAVRSGVLLQQAFICDVLCTSDESLAARDAALSAAELFEVTPQVFEKLAFGDRADGVLGVAELPESRMASIKLPERPLVAVLEGVQKPGNIGAVLRSADGAGVSAVIIADGGTDLYNPNTIRASLGTIFSVPIAAAPAGEVIRWLKQGGLAIYAAQTDATQLYSSADFTVSAAIVLGSEADGLSDAWRSAGITPIRLPMHGIADSLNVSATAAVLFYEALRQRQG